MKRNILLLIVAAGLIFVNSGCTSQESQDEEAPIENADVEQIDAPAIDGADSLAATTETPPAEATADDKSLEASLDEPTVTTSESTAEAPAPDATPTPEVSAAPTMDDSSLNLGDSPAPATDVAAATEAPPPSTMDTGSTELTETPVTDPMATAGFTEAPPEKVAASPTSSAKSSGSGIKKVSATNPYQAKDGGWVNTVYIARPKEKLADISQKIPTRARRIHSGSP